jgi:hypothetical protein
MELVSHHSLPATLLSWSRTGTPSSTLVCKITLELSQGTAKVAATQLPLLEEDQHVEDDATKSLIAANDLSPFKPRADVLLVGQAYAPQGEPVRSLVARLSVAGIDKAIEVHCDRVLTPNGKILDGPWFTDMPLVYERAAGGAGTDNPVGVPPDATADDHFGTQLPNLEPLNAPAAALGLRRTLVGFGPLVATWPERIGKAGRSAASFLDGSWATRALPKDFDPAFFNVAPLDQRVDRLAEGLRLTLENLHPQHPRLVCTLPRVRPRVFTEVGGALDEFAVTADTLWIDTTRAIATLTFRGQLSPRPGAHRVHVLLEEAVRPYAQADVRRICDVAPAGARTSAPPSAPSRKTMRLDEKERPPTPPRSAEIRTRSRVEEVTCADETNSGDASPQWLRKGLPGSPGSEPPPSERTQSIVMAAPQVTAPSTAPLPSAASIASQIPAPIPSPMPSPAMGSSPPAAPSRPATVWATPAHVQAEGYAGEGRKSRPQFSDDTPFARASFSSNAALDGPLAIPVGAPPIDPTQGAALLSLSNAAAARVPEPPRVDDPEDLRIEPAPASDERATPAPILDLLWFDPDSLDRVRTTTRWVERIAASRPPVFDPEEAGGKATQAPSDEMARGEVLAVLSSGAATPISGLGGALAAAAKLRRGFAPPLVVAIGELTPSFDEIDTLKATLSATSPFVPGDKKLKEVTDLCTELLGTPWLDGATEVVEGLIARVRDAFHASSRGLPPSFLDTRVERTLLKQRKYLKATVLGKTWIRAQLAEPNGGTPVPVYLSDALAQTLPMFRRFAVRLIADVHLAQDQFEAHPYALRAVAVARESPAQHGHG